MPSLLTSPDPIARAQDFAERCQDFSLHGNHWQAKCPAHDDHVASMTITPGDGKVLLHCHAGCSVQAILGALGLKLVDLFTSPPAVNGHSRIVKEYDYIDLEGALRHQTVRFEPKKFSQRRPDPAHPGQWIWNLQGIDLILYNFQAVIAAIAGSETLYIVEGEKDVETLGSMGLIGTCNALGAEKWRTSYSAMLTGAHVVILPDNDEAGQKHAQVVQKALTGVAASIRVVRLPGLADHGDVSDWVRAGGTREALEALLSEHEETEEAPLLSTKAQEALSLLLEDLEERVGIEGQQIIFDAVPSLLGLSVGQWEDAKAQLKARIPPLDKRKLETVWKAAHKAQQQAERTERKEQAPKDTRPLIEIYHNSMKPIADHVENLLLREPGGPFLFHRATKLCHIGRSGPQPKWMKQPADLPRICMMTEPWLREHIDGIARFVTITVDDNGFEQTRNSLPPAWLIETIMHHTEWPFPKLEGVATIPILRQDGSVETKQGYDKDTGLYLDYGGIVFPPLRQRVTLDTARSAIGVLQEVFADFCFATPGVLSAALAATLTIIGRHAFTGNTPLFVVRSPTPGTGKGRLINAICTIGTGQPAPSMPPTTDVEEERKRLFMIALSAIPAIHVDNVSGSLGSAALDQALTGGKITARQLGSYDQIHAPWSTVLFASGNNLALKGDLARRVVPIDLDPHMERPEERSGFRHDPLIPWVVQEYPRLAVAALTILQGYFAAGCPKQILAPMGSFEEWSLLIRQTLVWAGEPDPCEGRAMLTAESDPDLEKWGSVLAAWSLCYPQGSSLAEKVSLARVQQDIPAYEKPTEPECQWRDLRDALGGFDAKYDGKRWSPTALAYVFRKYQKRIVYGLQLSTDGRDRTGKTYWKITKTS